MIVQQIARQAAGLAGRNGGNARVVECPGNCLLISGSEVRILVHPPINQYDGKIRLKSVILADL
jgi:hypothetical protein